MKTALISILAATILGFASFAGGRHFDAADFVSITFAVGLAAWTIGQYSRVPRPLTWARPIHLPVTPVVRREAVAQERLAA